MSSNTTQEENACICPQAQGLHNQRNEYTTSDENIVVIYVLGILAFYTCDKRPYSKIEVTSCFKWRYRNTYGTAQRQLDTHMRAAA